MHPHLRQRHIDRREPKECKTRVGEETAEFWRQNAQLTINERLNKPLNKGTEILTNHKKFISINENINNRCSQKRHYVPWRWHVHTDINSVQSFYERIKQRRRRRIAIVVRKVSAHWTF